MGLQCCSGPVDIGMTREGRLTVMQTLREKKVFFIDTLSADARFVLQHVEQDQIITKREYNNLNHSYHTQEDIIINLLDKITEYKMSSVPRGFCVIINNMKFDPPLKDRNGSDADEESLKEVFTWLRFTPEVHRDQTAQQMKDLFRHLSQRHHEGDCFVCCILSHGDKEGVYGTDGVVVPNEDIFAPFRGSSCRSLAGKPKVFFIQACRGDDYQLPVDVEADNLVEDEETGQAELEMDVVEVSIPADGDFLVARSTVKGFYSFRDKFQGSWFIQSLCKQLKNYCPKCEDIQSILLCVNQEVSGKAARMMIRYKMVTAKQMPVQKVTLRKKLVFRVPG
ncbi:hypothetical protein NFI96_020332 [Prochilodus magdalenae]|nr:hypothetical protein NFI96_020332 [Prochilodus magdalenae]